MIMNHEGKATLNLAHGWKMVVATNKIVPQETQLLDSKVDDFRQMLRNGSQQPTILVYPVGDGMFKIRDGEYRYQALTAEGIDRADCIVVGGPGEE
jgi:ParB-like chromosome segregation protein Spo0J